ncbi:MAG TPA: VOC family protein [Chloroflexota bacterium]|nr:VOC family protein [Chloroflexota bacterium]
MSVRMHHALVPSKDAEASATWFAKVMNLPREGTSVRLNDVQVLEFVPHGRHSGQGGERHFCFRVGDQQFDQLLERVRAEGITIRSDPGGAMHPGANKTTGQINYYHYGRGFYFTSPDGHGFEAITMPYVRGKGGHQGDQQA